jgi:curved DNA-binding protein CbpA
VWLSGNQMKNASKKMINYYDLLGINSKADAEEIKRAYYDKLKIWHPDKNVGNTEAAEEKTKMLNQAYSVLSDPAQRKQYDRILRYTEGKDFSRILNEKEFWRKIEKASPSLKHILEDLKDLYMLFIDSIKGRYKLHPALLSVIGGGLLYFIIPLDLIPDFIPIAGLLDDFAVLSAIINSMQEELLEYRKFKSK